MGGIRLLRPKTGDRGRKGFRFQQQGREKRSSKSVQLAGLGGCA
ncbi:Uncharacterized protein pbN1_37540 [Aromatoleum bremense]|nr:Uncharacterized protein pbN1_37540 [Aromatoleum bremense]